MRHQNPSSASKNTLCKIGTAENGITKDCFDPNLLEQICFSTVAAASAAARLESISLYVFLKPTLQMSVLLVVNKCYMNLGFLTFCDNTRCSQKNLDH